MQTRFRTVLNLRALDLAGTKAAGANAYGLVSSVDHSLDLSDVRLPCAVGSAMRMGNALSEDNALAANTALCHLYIPPILFVGNKLFDLSGVGLVRNRNLAKISLALGALFV